MDQEPLVYPSRLFLPLDPGIADRQLWAIGMIVVQWGMSEFIREQEVLNIIGDDAALSAQYERLRRSQEKNKFWKTLVETKKQDPDRRRLLDLISRFESLNNKRDDVVHRLWGGGVQSGSPASLDGFETMDASIHRNRDEKIKSKSQDARANIRWRLSFTGLREIARDVAQLNNEFLAGWRPSNSPSGLYDIFAFTLPNGQLSIGITARSPESDPGCDTKSQTARRAD